MSFGVLFLLAGLVLCGLVFLIGMYVLAKSPFRPGIDDEKESQYEIVRDSNGIERAVPIPDRETKADWAKRQRENAIVFEAMRRGRIMLEHGDAYGAAKDCYDTLKLYGWNAPWLDGMMFDFLRNSSLEEARKFVNGFSCDEKAAKEWLETNTLEPL